MPNLRRFLWNYWSVDINLDFIISELETFVYLPYPINFPPLSRSTNSLKTLSIHLNAPPPLVFKSVKKLCLASNSKPLITQLHTMFPVAERILVVDCSEETFDVIPLIHNIIKSRQPNWEYIAYWKTPFGSPFSPSDLKYLQTHKIPHNTDRIIVTRSPEGEVTWRELPDDEYFKLHSSHWELQTFSTK